MQNNRYFYMALVAVAILSGCSSMPQSTSLEQAHGRYNSARNNPDVTSLAAVQLQQAGDTLSKADQALKNGAGADAVDHLAYIAGQQVSIAQETAKRKTAELAVTNAAAKRDQVRLEARTAEADTAKQQVATAHEEAAQQTAALAAAGAQTERDQALIAKQEQELKELNAKKTKRGMVITLGDVLFRTNKAHLESGGMRNVRKLADFLKEYSQYRVLVEGYTDSTGSNSHNQDLSERRADAARTALVDMGVSSDRVTTRGYGEEYPIAGNDTASGRQLNRRVEIILSDDKGNIAPR